MKIVIISQVLYPALSPRSHRTTQLAIEFARQGHDVTVYGLLGNYDYSEFVSRTNIKVKTLGKSILGNTDTTGKSNRNIFVRVLRRLLERYILFPQVEMFPMVRKALKNEGNIDLLITIAVPYINHFAVAYSDLKNVGCWISDCGDPFMGNKFFSYPAYFKNIEKKWCTKTDYIIVPIESAKDAYYPEFREKIEVIPQGFDFTNVTLSVYKKNKVPTFAYSGVVYKGLRDPTKFLDYLSSVDYEFKFIVYTKSLDMFLPYKDKLEDKLELRTYIPREKLLYELSKADFLINIENRSKVQSPSKLIDYAMTKRPCISFTSEFKEKNIFEEFIRGDYSHQYVVENLEQYDIKNVVSGFLDLYYKKTRIK